MRPQDLQSLLIVAAVLAAGCSVYDPDAADPATSGDASSTASSGTASASATSAGTAATSSGTTSSAGATTAATGDSGGSTDPPGSSGSSEGTGAEKDTWFSCLAGQYCVEWFLPAPLPLSELDGAVESACEQRYKGKLQGGPCTVIDAIARCDAAVQYEMYPEVSVASIYYECSGIPFWDTPSTMCADEFDGIYEDLGIGCPGGTGGTGGTCGLQCDGGAECNSPQECIPTLNGFSICAPPECGDCLSVQDSCDVDENCNYQGCV